MSLAEWWINLRSWLRYFHFHDWSETWSSAYARHERVCYTCAKVQRW